jgi:50S ribosomal protein uL30
MPENGSAEGKEGAKATDAGGNGGDELYAVVRLRGSAKINPKISDALAKLRLRRVHSCTLLQGSKTNRGMLLHIEDFITWGQINSDVLVKMLEKRGKSKSGSRIDAKQAKAIANKIIKDGTPNSSDVRPVFGLTPPSGGFRSIRLQYPKGDLGDRGEKINELLMRMI